MQAVDAPLGARAPSFHAAANPHLFLRQQFVGFGVDDGFLCQLLFFECLVLRKVAGVREQSPSVQLHHARGHPVQKRPVVADGDHTAPVSQQQLFKPCDAVHVQVVGGLVQQQHVGPAHQGLGQRHAFALAARQIAHALAAIEVQPLQGFFHPLLPVPAVQRFQPALDRVQVCICVAIEVAVAQGLGFLHAGTGCFKNGVLHVQHGLLWHIGHPHPALHLQNAVVWLLQAGQNFQQRGLAGAVAPYQAHPLLSLQGKVGVVEQGHMTKGQLRVL